MMSNTIEHIFFDLDHTLWDFDKNSTLAFQMIFDKYAIPIGLDDFIAVYQPINLKYWKLYREEKIDKSTLRIRRLSETFILFDKTYPEEIIKKMAVDYIDFLPLHNHLIPDAKGLLHFLYPNYTLHIITNGFKEVQHKKLLNSGIAHYFATVTNSEEAGVKKPNPRIFEQALQKSGARYGNSMMIGDNYEADILGAEALGIKTICFNYHQETLPPQYIQVTALEQIKAIL